MRYAIYFMPDPESDLWRFGSQILGYDASTGLSTAFPKHGAFAGKPLAEWTREPARYGFHATLKAPFYLRAGTSEAQLLAQVRAFAATRQAFTEPPLKLAIFGRFIALTNSETSTALSRLSDDCVRVFDPFRAALLPLDRDRRLSHPLPSRQLAHLEGWGYPYVFEDFMFHMTLSASLDAEPRSEMYEAVKALYSHIAAPVSFDAIAVFVQRNPDARFQVLERTKFGG